MIFSTATGYALQALAALPGDGSIRRAKHLAETLNLPGPYLATILQSLVQAGLLESVRGPRGGFRLARPAGSITIGQVVEALEGPDALKGCVMGFEHCGPDNPCPLHPVWSQLQAQIDASLTQATLEDLQRMPPRRLARTPSPA
jgi:Rrf2 family transcriptional regulator, iron-sulfur cluster assembly transcription factor